MLLVKDAEGAKKHTRIWKNFNKFAENLQIATNTVFDIIGKVDLLQVI